MKLICNRLKLARLRVGERLNCRDLSIKIGLHNSVISDLESGRRNTVPEKASLICKYFKLDLEELFTIEGTEFDEYKQFLSTSKRELRTRRITINYIDDDNNTVNYLCGDKYHIINIDERTERFTADVGYLIPNKMFGEEPEYRKLNDATVFKIDGDLYV